MCWVGVVVSRWVVGSCALCWDGVGVGGSWALRAALRRRGGSVGSWHAVLGRRGGLAVVGWRGRMEVVRVHEWAAISRVLRRVGAARWVGGGGVARQDGGGSHAQMGCNLQGLVLCWGGEVGWRWWGVGAGWRWLACTNGGFACHVGAAGWWWWRVVSHVGAACWGRDEWKRLACTRGRQWPAMLKVSCGDGPRGITAWW
ncbi:hypothetical protein EDB89DRAFT_1903800 [Lactarius sanguifluus]|nr:hypothetical protein EDB89DRAFT_1903800 [Lactarius sanguifluus]